MNKIDTILFSHQWKLNENIQKKTKRQSNLPQTKFHTLVKDTMSLSPHISSAVLDHTANRSHILDKIEGNPDNIKLYQASQDFSSFFMEKVFKSMQKNIPRGGLIAGGHAEEIFKDMLLTERTKGITKQTNSGLAEMIYQSLTGL